MSERALPRGPLFLASFLVLFLELVLIRYLGTEIPVVGFFKNLILIAAFLGFGVGLASRLRVDRAFLLFPAALVPPTALVAVLDLKGANEIPFSGLPDDAVLLPSASPVPGIALLVLAFAFTIPPLVFLGRVVGAYFDAFQRPLQPYGWNIVGSLAGTLAFTAVSAASLPAGGWFLVVGLSFALLVLWDRGLPWRPTRRVAVGGASLVAAVIVAAQGGADTIWTPYYKVRLLPMTYRSGEQTGYQLQVNNTWFQRSFDMRYVDRPEETAEEAHAARHLRFAAPFRFAGPDRVLVLGSGLGNDAASALNHGVAHVDAVDIDPVIPRLSDAYHPDRPYRDPRVTLVIDDARHYLSVRDERYDLLLFGVLEARSLFSQFANLRLDNYVYTVEALELAREHLTDGGVVWLNMWVPRPWIRTKLEGAMTQVFGESTAVLRGIGSDHYGFVGCVSCDLSRLPALADSLPGVEMAPPPDASLASTVPTDDWPYIFYRTRNLPAPYLLVLAGLSLLSLIPVRLVSRETLRVEWGFFFLGTAFLLVETTAVTRMALLAGTTWVVNSAVFAGVLVFIFLANWIVAKRHVAPGPWPFVWLWGALVLAYAFPFQRLLEAPNALAIAAGAGILTLPVLFSGVVFSAYFRLASSPSRALASNLLGAVLGGFFEYSSLLVGHRSMALVACLLYAAALTAFLGTPARGRIVASGT